MKVLLKQAVILDPVSSNHNVRKDIFVDNGVIKAIEKDIQAEADKVVQSPDLHVSPGWMDVFAQFCDPGYEHKETLESGAAAAAAGGFTRVMTVPNTNPVVDNKSQVNYVTQQSNRLAAQVIPIGAATKKAEGKELAEMYDMFNSGALAFGDGLNPIQSAGILLKALQYVKAFDGVIIQVPDDKSIAAHALMNEGLVSTRLGLPGKPILAEELMVERDLKLLEYTGSKLHFTGISSPKSVQYIQEARQKGLQVTCSVTPFQLYFCDEDLQTYDTNLKVNPPLRTRDDMMALRKAVAEGLIDCIATHHLPQDYDAKVVEFEYAKNGMIGLQTCYPVLKTILPEVKEEQWIKMLSIHPTQIFGIATEGIQVGNHANLTLFDPSESFTFREKDIRSKSANSPFINTTFKGKIIGTLSNKHLFLAHQD